MSAKPTLVPTWATGASYPADGEPEAGSPTKIAPPGGKATTGWRPEEYPPAQYFNHLQNLNGQWAKYLDDGALVGDHSIDGSLLLDRTVPDSDPILIADGDVLVTGEIVAADLRFGQIRSRRIPGLMAMPDPPGAHTKHSAGVTITSNDGVYYPLIVEVGDRIDGWLVWIHKTSNATQTLQARLGYVLESSGVATYVGATQTNAANNPGRTALTLAGLAHDVVGDASYFIECSAFGSISPGADTFLGAELNYTRP